MSDRSIPFEPELVCDICQKKGAYDFMSDFLCPECASNHIKHEACNRCGHDPCICGT